MPGHSDVPACQGVPNFHGKRKAVQGFHIEHHNVCGRRKLVRREELANNITYQRAFLARGIKVRQRENFNGIIRPDDMPHGCYGCGVPGFDSQHDASRVTGFGGQQHAPASCIRAAGKLRDIMMQQRLACGAVSDKHATVGISGNFHMRGKTRAAQTHKSCGTRRFLNGFPAEMRTWGSAFSCSRRCTDKMLFVFSG